MRLPEDITDATQHFIYLYDKKLDRYHNIKYYTDCISHKRRDIPWVTKISISFSPLYILLVNVLKCDSSVTYNILFFKSMCLCNISTKI